MPPTKHDPNVPQDECPACQQEEEAEAMLGSGSSDDTLIEALQHAIREIENE